MRRFKHPDVRKPGAFCCLLTGTLFLLVIGWYTGDGKYIYEAANHNFGAEKKLELDLSKMLDKHPHQSNRSEIRKHVALYQVKNGDPRKDSRDLREERTDNSTETAQAVKPNTLQTRTDTKLSPNVTSKIKAPEVVSRAKDNNLDDLQSNRSEEKRNLRDLLQINNATVDQVTNLTKTKLNVTTDNVKLLSKTERNTDSFESSTEAFFETTSDVGNYSKIERKTKHNGVIKDKNNSTSINKNSSRINYIIENPTVCYHGDVDVLIFVETSVTNEERRMAVRRTWGRKEFLNILKVRVIFVLGTTTTERTESEEKVRNETSVYGDIIQGDFIDSYKNLTTKGLFAFQWIVQHCLKAKLVIKVDDDMFINIFKLRDIVKQYGGHSKLFVCDVRPNGTGVIERDESSKWLVTDARFDGMTYFPVTYCYGYIVMLTTEMLPDLVREVPNTPLFWIEDVYLYGLLPSKLEEVEYKSIYGNLSVDEIYGLLCHVIDPDCNLVATRVTTTRITKLLWYTSLNFALRVFRNEATSVQLPFYIKKELKLLRAWFKNEEKFLSTLEIGYYI